LRRQRPACRPPSLVPMRMGDSQLLVFTLACVALVAIAALLMRGRVAAAPGARLAAWCLLAAGLGGLALLALATFAGRLGPEHLWFREPVFYVAVVVLAGALAWWLRRPARRLLRFGLPALLICAGAGALLLGRVDGRAAPLAMLMPTLGRPAPELLYIDESERPRRLADLQGRVVLLNFWATWCVPCRREMPLLSQMQRDHADEGLVVLYVSLEDPEVLEPFLAENHFDGIEARLAHAADFYDAGKFYPLSYLISRDGRVAQRWSGRPREEWLQEKIRELL
jgi:cytochrome c biogenesis protein CcmG, thiol:disulfide interchange protein DsbE